MTTNRIRRAIGAALSAAVLAGTGAAYTAAPAHADPYGCQTVLWGFLGTQRRTICDSSSGASGQWWRQRQVWVPAHYVPLTTSCGSYSCTSYGGYFQPFTEVAYDEYPVTPDTVLPDEPGNLRGSAA